MPTPKQENDGSDSSDERSTDESQILTDQDMTTERDISALDEKIGAKSTSLEAIEDEAPDFMQGEIDVKEQMDRTADIIADSLQGAREVRDDDDDESELVASFRDTPGGLEEVIMKTDKEVIRRKSEPSSDQHPN